MKLTAVSSISFLASQSAVVLAKIEMKTFLWEKLQAEIARKLVIN